jgi:hypothetical protein
MLLLWSVSVREASAQGFAGTLPTIAGTATGTIQEAIGRVINGVAGVLAAVAVAFIVAGGIRILTAGGNEQSVQSGKKMIIYALVGLAIIFFAYVGLNFIFTVVFRP